MINGGQCPTVWHFVDLTILHKDPKVLSDIIEKLKEEYGKVSEMTVTRGKVHDYLRMMLDFSNQDKVMISMESCIDQILCDLPEGIKGSATSPAAKHLFKLKSSPESLNKETVYLCHHIMVQLLFLCKCTRPDIQNAVSALCTKVKGADKDDYKMLARVMKYLH